MLKTSLKKNLRHRESIACECWHAFTEEEVFAELKTSRNGLGPEEVSSRLRFYGANRLPEGKKITLVQIIFHQLLNPLIFILVAAAIASIVIGEIKDAFFILLVIFINTALGVYMKNFLENR